MKKIIVILFLVCYHEKCFTQNDFLIFFLIQNDSFSLSMRSLNNLPSEGETFGFSDGIEVLGEVDG